MALTVGTGCGISRIDSVTQEPFDELVRTELVPQQSEPEFELTVRRDGALLDVAARRYRDCWETQTYHRRKGTLVKKSAKDVGADVILGLVLALGGVPLLLDPLALSTDEEVAADPERQRRLGYLTGATVLGAGVWFLASAVRTGILAIDSRIDIVDYEQRHELPRSLCWEAPAANEALHAIIGDGRYVLGQIDEMGRRGLVLSDLPDDAAIRLAGRDDASMEIAVADKSVPVRMPEWQAEIHRLAFERAVGFDTAEALEAFLRLYPRAQQRAAAMERLASIHWRAISTTNDVEALRVFAARFSQTRYYGLARAAMANIEFSRLKQAGTPESLLAFAESYDDTEVAELARILAEKIAWERLRGSKDPLAFYGFADLFPGSVRAEEALVAAERLEERNAAQSRASLVRVLPALARKCAELSERRRTLRARIEQAIAGGLAADAERLEAAHDDAGRDACAARAKVELIVQTLLGAGKPIAASAAHRVGLPCLSWQCR